MARAMTAPRETCGANLTSIVSWWPTTPGGSISRIDATTAHSLHVARLLVGGATARCDCVSLGCVSAPAFGSAACVDTAPAAGILAYDAGIERRIATLPQTANEQKETAISHSGGRA